MSPFNGRKNRFEELRSLDLAHWASFLPRCWIKKPEPIKLAGTRVSRVLGWEIS